jgi:hypothetical protein
MGFGLVSALLKLRYSRVPRTSDRSCAAFASIFNEAGEPCEGVPANARDSGIIPPKVQAAAAPPMVAIRLRKSRRRIAALFMLVPPFLLP